MGLFEEQIKERKDLDRQALEDSFLHIAGVVLGEESAHKLGDERIITKQAIDEILKYYHFKPVDVPDNMADTNDALDYCLRHYGLMKREVSLKENWYKDAFGPLLCFDKSNGRPIAVFPKMPHGYYYIDINTGKKRFIKSNWNEIFDDRAYCFYYPLPMKELSVVDLLSFMKKSISIDDSIIIALLAFLVALVGLLIPRITAALTGPVIESGRLSVLLGAAICMLAISVSSQFLTVIKSLIEERIQIKTSIAVESSMMIRLLTLPVSFFRNYSPGELINRSSSVNMLCQIMLGIFMNTGITALASLLYITQIFSFAPSLVIPSLITVGIYLIVFLYTVHVQIKVSKAHMEHGAKESGLTYSYITGIQKIKLSGAEKRFFARWLDIYAEGASLLYNPPLILKVSNVLLTGITLISTIIFYYISVTTGIKQSSYFAFTSAFGMLMGGVGTVSEMVSSIASIRPILDMAEPFLKTVPETSQDKEIVTGIKGNIELDHVSFRYEDNSSLIIDDLSLKIKSGEYVAIVGKTGCGKTTLLRLLLGFEKPNKGAIYYDKKDIRKLDLSSLRKHIGTVTQDGGLFSGDIYSNIVITNPKLSMEDAWEAAEAASIADDIRAMPMGMFTMISEGQGGISGGQKQRLMIARAIANKPKLLLFDEATSALDNKTQKQVSDALSSMGCTRIVIAHRLSTIKHCDRILVLDNGKIIEEGTYEELIAKQGMFTDLVKRQRL